MNDNIQVVNKNGDILSVEGISVVEIPAFSKKYLFYTLNEKVDNDLTKIYIAEISDLQGGGEPIPDNEWSEIRNKMVKISHKEELTDVNYLPFGDKPLNVGEAKKLAVTAVAKQAFKDAHATHTLAVNQTATPAVSGESSFFTTPPASTNEQIIGGQMEQNIFNNPPVAQNVAVSETPVQNPEVVQTPEVSQVVGMQSGVVDSAALSNSPVDIAQAQVNQSVAEGTETAGPDLSQASIETPALGNEQFTNVAQVPENLENTSVISAVDNSGNGENPSAVREIISDEDALKAIGLIQDYIAQEEAA